MEWGLVSFGKCMIGSDKDRLVFCVLWRCHMRESGTEDITFVAYN